MKIIELNRRNTSVNGEYFDLKILFKTYHLTRYCYARQDYIFFAWERNNKPFCIAEFKSPIFRRFKEDEVFNIPLPLENIKQLPFKIRILEKLYMERMDADNSSAGKSS